MIFSRPSAFAPSIVAISMNFFDGIGEREGEREGESEGEREGERGRVDESLFSLRADLISASMSIPSFDAGPSVPRERGIPSE